MSEFVYGNSGDSREFGMYCGVVVMYGYEGVNMFMSPALLCLLHVSCLCPTPASCNTDHIHLPYSHPPILLVNSVTVRIFENAPK